MDAVLLMEIRFYGHLRRRQASLFHENIRFSAHRNPESHTLSIDSIRYFVYKFSAAFWAASLRLECHKPRLSTG
jgi:hypothetical protein